MPSAQSDYLQWVEMGIKKQRFGKEPASLYDPIHYLMGIGGKRVRPLLTLIGYSLYKQDVKSMVPYAVAMEVFHNFTLMHDDIMDNAPLRRGMTTVHEKWNVNTAILSGDVMLVKVYDMFLSLEPTKYVKVIGLLNACAADVCEGQQLDMEFETKSKVTEAQYVNMIRLKTAVLLGFCLELGAILADAPEEDYKVLRAFGTAIGIGFQLKDDLLDAYSDPKKFGKLVGGDIIANKKTWLLIKAQEIAKGKDRTQLEKWMKAKKFNKKEKVTAVKEIFDRLNIPALADRTANRYLDKAFSQLSELQTRIDITPLRQIVEDLGQRQS